MNRITFLLVAICTAVFSCDTETELKRSIFIADPDAPELPQYSEWGYNTFGAYYDRVAWTSTSGESPAKFINDRGATTFVLTGERSSGMYSMNERVRVEIVMVGVSYENYSELVALHDTTIDLTGTETNVVVTINEQTFETEVLEGQLRFTRAQSLHVDEELREVILSGRFDLRFLVDGEPVTLSDGRFDIGIDEDNFFKL